MKNLIGISKEELAQIVAELGEKPFRTKQLWQWIYHFGVKSFDEMSNVSKDLRSRLAEDYSLERHGISKNLISLDKTRKWLVRFQDGNEVETVYIPEEDRGSLCVSSQVGCTLTCKFCHTGTQKLVRNLTAEEIVGQFMLARDELSEWPSSKEPRMLTNIVMMGMGEPLLNYDNVVKALRIIIDEEGIAISKRKVTLSTSGIVPAIRSCARDLGVNLAISLHAVTNELRNELVPINKKYPLEELISACRDYSLDTSDRRITFEYVMLKDVNDSDADARALIKLIGGIPAKVNLIPFNPWPGTVYERSSKERIDKFARIIFEAGYHSPVRTPRGEDILAACGQLKSDSERQKKQNNPYP